ncbi:molybdopterin molybdotransferase MoeA [Flocculibacter collagenilyticus]|uniref:molybdopterin molybdotransferase MoeA n=1 Tax=Flocculibacter collagenilyticus TaxID=2744479 RepID=UPI0018F2A3BD|nr:gephyrin-like molybdotransferase Glp [Flocculibacter collagenilyticus]
MADCFTGSDLMPFNQALTKLLNAVPRITDTELITVEEADKRVLSDAIYSPINVPAFNNASMDGYALRDDHLHSNERQLTDFKLAGVALAGQPFTGELKHGECIRIMTGAVVPETANTVVMQENVANISNTIGSTITLTHAAKLNNNIRFAGENIKRNQVVFEQGHQLKAVDIGLLASLGLAHVTVYRKVKVAVFSTGDELRLAGEPLQQGDIYESNSQVIMAMLTRMGADVIPMGIIADDKTAIKNAFLTANEQADVVISSGGVSVGDADYIKDVLSELGNINFWKVAMKPGNPFAFGELPNSVFFGLPGNPVSAAVTLHQLAIPAIHAMSGTAQPVKITISAITLDKIKKRPGRMDFQRGIASVNSQGQLQVTPLAGQGSGILSSLSYANCYIVLAQENAGHEKGDVVQVQLFDHIIG